MKRNRTILQLLCLLFAAASVLPSAHGDWPAFRGPNRDGIVSVSLPKIWSKEENIAWRTEIPGVGWSSPILAGKEIFFTTAVEMPSGGYDLRLVGVDSDTGAVNIITRLFSEPSDAPRIHKKNSHASPTPIFDGENIYVHFGHLGTACVSAGGQVKWKNDNLNYPPVHGNGGSPALVDDLLIFSRDGGDIAEVTALNKETGKVVWQTKREVEAKKSFSFCTPLVATIEGRKQLILPGSNVVQSLDPATGKEYWRLRYDGYSVIPRPIYHEGLVFICTGYNTPSLLAIDPTGTGDVTDTHLKWQSKDNIPHTPSLVAYEDGIAMVSDRGVATMVNAKTGEQVWKRRVDGGFSASPLLSGSHLYLLSEKGDCTVLDLSTKQPTEVAVNSVGERCLASFAVLGSDLLLRSADALYCIRSK